MGQEPIQGIKTMICHQSSCATFHRYLTMTYRNSPCSETQQRPQRHLHCLLFHSTLFYNVLCPLSVGLFLLPSPIHNSLALQSPFIIQMYWSVCQSFVTSDLSSTICTGPVDAEPSHLGSPVLSLQVHESWHLCKLQRGYGVPYLLMNLSHAASLYHAHCLWGKAIRKVRRVTKGFKIFK